MKDEINELGDRLLACFIDLQNENERLKKQNNDLRKIYKNTYKRLFENGNEELARYFQAQIDDCPTFYAEPIIDYAKEYKKYKSRIDKAIEYIKSYNLPEDLGSLSECPISVGDLKELLNILNGDE